MKWLFKLFFPVKYCKKYGHQYKTYVYPYDHDIVFDMCDCCKHMTKIRILYNGEVINLD